MLAAVVRAEVITPAEVMMGPMVIEVEVFCKNMNTTVYQASYEVSPAFFPIPGESLLTS